MYDFFHHFIFLLGCTTFLWLLKFFISSKTPTVSQPPEKRILRVQDICHTWMPESKDTKLIIERTGYEVPTVAPNKRYFHNDEIQEFWAVNCANLQEPYLAIVQDVLLEYDNPDEQLTSSVVRVANSPKEHDNSLSDEVYKTLSRVPLWRHILDTGQEYIGSVPAKDRGGPLYCLSLIACLSHDIAKLKRYIKKNYTTGDHAPHGAQILMSKINGRMHIENEKELLDAVRKHHDKKHHGTTGLTSRLLTADAKARERELRLASITTFSAEQEYIETYSSEICLSWFDPAEFLKYLIKYINLYTDNTRFAVSSKDGHIYFTLNVIYDCFKKLAHEKNAPEKLLFESQEDRKKLLIYISDEMLKYGSVAPYYVQAGFHSAKFVTTFDDRPGVMSFSPYKAEAFGINVHNTERDKTSHLKKFKIVKPDYSGSSNKD